MQNDDHLPSLEQFFFSARAHAWFAAPDAVAPPPVPVRGRLRSARELLDDEL